MGMTVVIMGVSGSGKSTVGRALAEATGGRFFDGDDFHPAANVEKMRAGTPLDDRDRQGWLERLRDLLAEESTGPQPVFLACSALKKSYRDVLREGNAGLRFVFLHGPEELLRDRMRARKGHYMPPGLLTSQLEALEPPDDAIAVDVSKAGPATIDELLGDLGLARK
jgi:gluconokinase